MSAARPSRAKPRGTYHHGDLRRAVLDAAAGLIRERGSEAFTLREAARVVGVDHAAVYRHFEDKRALLAAVAEEGFVALGDRIRAAMSAHPESAVLDRLRALASAYVGFALDDPAHFQVMLGPRLNEDGRFPTLESAIEGAVTLLLDEVRRGRRLGLLRDARTRDMAMTVWTAAHGYAALALLGRIKHGDSARAAAYLEVVIGPVLAGLQRA